MRDQLGSVERTGGDRVHQLRNRQAGRDTRGDGDLLGPQRFQVERGRTFMDSDVGDVAAGANEIRGEFERIREADGFGRDVGTQAAGQLRDQAVDLMFVDGVRRTEFQRDVTPAWNTIDDDEVARREQLRGQGCGQAYRPGSDDDDG